MLITIRGVLATVVLSCFMPTLAKADSIDDLFQDYVGNQVPGASVLVIQSGEVVEQRSFGNADVEQQIAVTPETNFRLASLSKQFTAMAVLILAERGQLKLEDPVGNYLSNLPTYLKGIKIIHLLNHTSGLQDYEDHIPRGQTEQLKDADVVRILTTLSSTYFTPGSSYRYSNSGYATLAHLVAVVSGTRFSSFLKENIFVPLGMEQTEAFENGINEVPNRAYGYTGSGTRFSRTDQSITSAVLGDGGVYTSIKEYALWDAALYGSSIVRPDTLAKMFDPGRLNNGTRINYAMGWSIDTWNGTRRVSHTGSTIGFRSAVLRFPEKKLTVVVLVNRANVAPWDKAEQIARMFW